jgi:hypothetical protein
MKECGTFSCEEVVAPSRIVTGRSFGSATYVVQTSTAEDGRGPPGEKNASAAARPSPARDSENSNIRFIKRPPGRSATRR